MSKIQMLKFKIIFLFLISGSVMFCDAQITRRSEKIESGAWIKSRATAAYSLQHDKNEKEEFLKQYRQRYDANLDINKLTTDLRSNNPQTRLNAVTIFGQMPGNNQVPTIETMLVSDPINEVRMECAKSLKFLKSNGSIPYLLKALKTNDNQLKMEVALSLASLGEKKECFKGLRQLSATGERNLMLDAHLGFLDLANDDAVSALKSDLTNQNPYVSVDAAIVLAELKYYKEAFPILKSKLLDQDKYIRICALRGLAYIGNNESISLIKSMLSDRDQMVRDRSFLILKKCNLY